MDKLRRSQKWVCAIVLTLGVVSALLGFLAEANRIKSTEIRISDDECIYPNSPALILGVIAALVLFAAQILVNVVGGCICCTPMPPPPPNSPAANNRSIATICLAACWITFVNAFALLMAGASLNNERQQYMWFGGECNVVKPLVFAGGALLALATVVLGLIFYLAASAAKAASLAAEGPPRHNIALGQPAYGHPYPAYYGPTMVNAQPYSFPYPPGHLPPQAQIATPTNPNIQAYPLGYPDVVTGYPKPMPPPSVAV